MLSSNDMLDALKFAFYQQTCDNIKELKEIDLHSEIELSNICECCGAYFQPDFTIIIAKNRFCRSCMKRMPFKKGGDQNGISR